MKISLVTQIWIQILVFSKACKLFNKRLKQMPTKDSYKWGGREEPTFAQEPWMNCPP